MTENQFKFKLLSYGFTKREVHDLINEIKENTNQLKKKWRRDLKINGRLTIIGYEAKLDAWYIIRSPHK